MRIQELEQLVHADRATIRYYEKEGLILPNRSDNGYRQYTEENVSELKRILLLRQLGVSVYTIRQLQKGSMDFSDVMSRHIEALSEQISREKQARALCEVIRNDGISYAGMDADHYSRLLKEIQPEERSTQITSFSERLPQEIHPWRRFFARWMDYALACMVVDLLIVIVLRIRPLPGNFLNILISIAIGMLLVPLEALLLSKFGTTPGKYAMGIRVETINGGYLTWEQAMNREWAVLRDGACFYIPLLHIWSLLRCYLQLTGRSSRRFVRKEDVPDPEEMRWDEECEILYQNQDRKRGVVLAGILVFILLLGTIIGLDSVKPRYRGHEITVEQFASNYNHMLTVLQSNSDGYDKLQPDGSRLPIPNAILGDGTPIYDNAYIPEAFLYETEDGILKSITIQRAWENVFIARPMGSDTVNATFAVLLGQKDIQLWDMPAFADKMAEAASMQQGTMIVGEHIVITWQIDYENYICQNGTYYKNDRDAEAWIQYQYTIKIQ